MIPKLDIQWKHYNLSGVGSAVPCVVFWPGHCSVQSAVSAGSQQHWCGDDWPCPVW